VPSLVKNRMSRVRELRVLPGKLALTFAAVLNRILRPPTNDRFWAFTSSCKRVLARAAAVQDLLARVLAPFFGQSRQTHWCATVGLITRCAMVQWVNHELGH
jgi:hypothetical protein